MTGERHWYAVDRIERDRAILVGDCDLPIVAIPLASLPLRVREGMVLRVPMDARGDPQWARTERDEPEERRRNEDGEARLDRVRRRDPGGDAGVTS